MTTLSKVTKAGASAVSPIHRVSKSDADAHGQARQGFANSGDALPAVQAHEPDADTQRRQLNEAMRDVSDQVQKIFRELNFNVDEEVGHTVVTVIDELTGEMVRQIPSDDMLQLAKNLDILIEADMKGLLFKGDA